MGRTPGSLGEGRATGRTASSASAVGRDPVVEVGRLVLAAVTATVGEGEAEAPGFLRRRAGREISGLPAGAERRLLGKVVRALEAPQGDRDSVVCALLEWAGHLEARGHLAEAEGVIVRARRICPSDPELLLHQGRIARKRGERQRAGRLYERVRRLDSAGGRLTRMAAVGRGMVGAGDGQTSLGEGLREARRAGDREAEAVAREERARLRRRRGELEAALRDYAVAAFRFRDPADRGRVGHEAADMLLAAGELGGARSVLRATEGAGHPREAERARVRLREVARSIGDELGIRRWAGRGAGDLVSLGPPPWKTSSSSEGPGEKRKSRLRRNLNRFLTLS